MNQFLYKIYVKIFISLATKYSVRLFMELLIYAITLYLVAKYINNNDTAATATTIIQQEPIPEPLVRYKELLKEYSIKVPQKVDGTIDLKLSAMFVNSKLNNAILGAENVIQKYTATRLLYLPKLTEVEKVLSLNYLSTVLACHRDLLDNVHNEFVFKIYYLDYKDILIKNSTKIMSDTTIPQIVINKQSGYHKYLIIAAPITVALFILHFIIEHRIY